MENDLIFAAETDDALFAAAADTTQIAAAATPSAELLPVPRETAKVVVPQGETVVQVPVAPGEIVELPFPSDAHFLARLDDGNLAIKVGDLTIILEGYAEAAGEKAPVIEAADGQPLDIAAILAATDPSIEIETAAGPAGAQGQGADNTGALLTQFAGAQGGLGGFTGAGGQEGSDTPGRGPGVDQTGTLFKQFADLPTPTSPNASDFKFTTDEESKIAGKVVAADPQGDVLTYALVGTVPAGLKLNPDGSWTFDPVGKYDQLNTDHPGQISFQYKASDGVHDSNTATVTIDIAGVNDAPELLTGVGSIAFPEDSPNFVQPLNWKISDPDDTDITVTVDKSTLPPGVTYDASKGEVHFDTLGQYDYLAAGETAEFKLKFTIADAHGGFIEQDFSVGIIGENDAPVAADDIVLTNAGTGTYGVFFIPDWALLLNDKDVDSTSLHVSPGLFGVNGLDDLAHQSGGFLADEDDTLGASFSYLATDGSDNSNSAAVGIHNQQGGDITGTDADEILIGGISGGKLDGGGGNDIILTSGGSGTFEVFGGAGDDILRLIGGKITQHGGTDSVASSGGLAADAANHGDMMIVSNDSDLTTIADKANVDGIETISTEAKFGAGDPQTLTLNAASVQQLSDHTITPGGGFGEHEAIRIDGDSEDQVYLSQDGGKWVDTAIEMVGYRVYAHETKAGEPASTDAYVMVQAANVANVHLNPPVASDDIILTTVGTKVSFPVPEWALLANDRGGPNLDVAKFDDLQGLTGLSYSPDAGTTANVTIYENDTPGGSFKYVATDEGTLSKEATVKIINSEADGFVGGDADEIMVGRAATELLAGGGGNDIIFGRGGDGDRLYGQAGDDIIEFEQDAQIHGGTDSVGSSGGLAGGVDSHGDVMITAKNLSLVDAKGIDGLETISTQEKFGGTGAQVVTIDAAGVQQISDHTITPGGGFGEHDAVRIDGDLVDQLYLAIGKDGGQWVDTSIEVAGYHVYAHETTGGDPGSADAYVMVQAANTGSVHLNQDGAPVAVDDIVLTNLGPSQAIFVPEWMLVANDKSVDGANLDVVSVGTLAGGTAVIHYVGVGSNGDIAFVEDTTLGGSFGYTATDGSVESKRATVSVQNQDGGDITGTDADEILIGSSSGEKLAGGGGNDIIFGGAGGEDEIFGGAGDDTIQWIQFQNIYHGGTDTVASSGGLAAGADNHGDVLVRYEDLDLTLQFEAAKVDGIETISTQEKLGTVGTQIVTIDAASVQQLSDHTITPGRGFGEHDAIRIDSDSADKIYLAISKDGEQWVDTAIELAGYRVYAHETIAGDAASTDAYVMVQAANVGTVHFPPVAVSDTIVTNLGPSETITVPEWALLANDRNLDGANLDVGLVGNSVGAFGISHSAGTGSNGTVDFFEDGTLGGSFIYAATDGSVESERATVNVHNQDGGDITGTDSDEILLGDDGGQTIDGGGGNDVIFGDGGHDHIFGGAGDDIIDMRTDGHGGIDNVASSGGLAASANNHGDVLVRRFDLDLADSADAKDFDGVETISTQEKFGATGVQTLTISAANVQQLSDHSISLGGGFGEHEAIRIDGDSVDQVNLSVNQDGGQWVDTAIEMVGYRVYAHETIGGDKASTDAYVMIQAANVANVDLNPLIARDDQVLTTAGVHGSFAIPTWALLANDGGSADLSVFQATGSGFSGLGMSKEAITLTDDNILGGTLEYRMTDGKTQSTGAQVDVENTNNHELSGSNLDEILIGTAEDGKLDGGGGNDIIFGGGADEIFGGAGEDVIDFIYNGSVYHGSTDAVASSNGLAAGADNHGDVMARRLDLDLANSSDAADLDGFETISTQEKFGGSGAQTLTIGAGSVQQISDHTITPGGVFAEHEAIRIDGDFVDQLYLSISKDGGKWVDTGIDTAGYHIFAHETTDGNAASTDAYVMVQTANTGNVHLNQDAP